MEEIRGSVFERRNGLIESNVLENERIVPDDVGKVAVADADAIHLHGNLLADIGIAANLSLILVIVPKNHITSKVVSMAAHAVAVVFEFLGRHMYRVERVLEIGARRHHVEAEVANGAVAIRVILAVARLPDDMHVIARGQIMNGLVHALMARTASAVSCVENLTVIPRVGKDARIIDREVLRVHCRELAAVLLRHLLLAVLLNDLVFLWGTCGQAQRESNRHDTRNNDYKTQGA